MADIPFLCIKPACGAECVGCNGALPSDQLMLYVKRYAWLRSTFVRVGELDAVFDNREIATWRGGTELDAAIDAALSQPAQSGTVGGNPRGG